MNYCTKCESFYQKPGTCNCFAGTQPAITITPQPVDPNGTVPPWAPWQPLQPWWGGWSYTIPSDGSSVVTQTIGSCSARPVA